MMASSKNKLVICWAGNGSRGEYILWHLLLVGNHNGQTKPAMRAQMKRQRPQRARFSVVLQAAAAAQKMCALPF